MMTSISNRETAKIYRFPAGGRAAMRTGRTVVMPIDELQAAAAAPRAVVGGSWYHEEAIRETEPTGKR